ncbi:MAG: glycosyltransferase family 2 protein [Rhodobacteraceae bacterium]|nr:glycosyltransferase family 2 protein [Paracoccaceae bacterium]
MHTDTTAVLTICRDDRYFLERFVQYYGGLFGRNNIYIISHGDEPMVREVAEGCNIFPVPAIETSKFTMLHWRTKNHLKNALRQWYKHVIVCDVDEFIVVDPASGKNLATWLDTAATGTFYTAMGLEIVHLRDREPDGIDQGILGPRLHTQVALHYAKPCIVSRRGKIGRGGHYAEYDQLNMPEFLYLFHMKYCDFDLFVETANRRNAFIEDQKKLATDGKVRTNPKWFADNRADEATFAAFADRPVETGFDLSHIRQAMHDSWEPRGNDLWHFHRPEYKELYKLPDRFAGADVAPD